MRRKEIVFLLIVALVFLAFICSAGAGPCLTAAVIIPGIPPLP